MSTRIYLPSSGAAPISPAFDGAWDVTTDADRVAAYAHPDGSAYAAVARAETEAAAANRLLRQYVVGPLAAQTIDGTIKGQVRAYESSGADLRAQMVVRVVSGDGATVRGTLRAADAAALSSEWRAFAYRNVTWPLAALSPEALNPVAAAAGDYLVIELGYRAHNAATGSYNGRIEVGGFPAAADLAEDETNTTDQLNPWIEFSADLTWQQATPRVSQTLLEVDLGVRVPLQVSQVLLEVDLEEASGFTGTAALSAQPAQIAATGSVSQAFTGTGAVAAQPAAIAGTGSYTPLDITGTGAVSVPAASIAGAGSALLAITGTGAVSTQPAEVAATGHYLPPLALPLRADYADVRAGAEYTTSEAQATYANAGAHRATYTAVAAHADYKE